MTTSHHGAKIGTRVSGIIVRAIIGTHKGLLSSKHKLAMLIFRSISDEISEEVDHTLGHYFAKMAEQCDTGEPVTNLLNFMAYDHGQLKALAGSSLVSQSLMWPISQILNNVLSPLVYTAVANDPRTILDPGTMASLAATGRFDYNEALHNIRKQGFDAPFGVPLIDASRTYPDVGQASDLLNRGEISADQFDAWALKNGIPASVSMELRKLAKQPVSPADAALGLLRGNISKEDAIKVASDWGLSEDSFTLLVDNTGEPPGLEQLLEAYRRQFIDEKTLKQGILESRIRNEWIPTLIKLRYAPMSVADAVNAVVQNHLTEADATTVAIQNGLDPTALPTLITTAGEPLARGEMEQLYNRGLVTAQDVEQAMRESRLKDKYTKDALQLHVRLLEPRMLSDAVTAGSLTHADAIKHAMDYGYSRDDATILVDASSKRKLQALHGQTIAAVVALYEENAIPQSTVSSQLKANGYDDAEIEVVLKTAEYRRESKIITATTSAIRAKFIAHHIDQKTASGYLDAVGIPSAQRDYLMGLWSIEEAANVRNLTEAQIVKAVHLKLIDLKDGAERLITMGYSDGDAALLLAGA